MPFPITLTPTGQVLQVPTSWADVSFAQFVALLAPLEGDPHTAAERLLGLEAGALDALAADDVHYLANLIAFAADPGPVLELLPSPELPDVGSLPWGCLVLVQQRLASDPERAALVHLPYVLAVYRCQLTYGSTDRVAEVEAALLAAPCTECYPEAQAFFSACRRSLSATPRTRATSPTTTKKSSMPGWKVWLSNLGRPSPSTPWRGATS